MCLPQQPGDEWHSVLSTLAFFAHISLHIVSQHTAPLRLCDWHGIVVNALATGLMRMMVDLDVEEWYEHRRGWSD